MVLVPIIAAVPPLQPVSVHPLFNDNRVDGASYFDLAMSYELPFMGAVIDKHAFDRLSGA